LFFVFILVVVIIVVVVVVVVFVVVVVIVIVVVVIPRVQIPVDRQTQIPRLFCFLIIRTNSIEKNLTDQNMKYSENNSLNI
jgi:hypothetical protein